MNKKYDYLIVGCGLYGATIANRAIQNKKSVLIIDKRDHIGGNAYTDSITGIDVHKYGPHIFHTSSEKIWNYINSFGKFNNYVHKTIAVYKNKTYSMPFNMMTFNQIFGHISPREMKEKILKDKQKYKLPQNLEEQAISMVGKEVYDILIRGYTQKQWNKNPVELPSSIIKRIPVRFTYNDNYYLDKYQGIPIEGYTKLIQNMIDGSKIYLGLNYLENREKYDSIAKRIIYTGPIDSFYDFCFGELEYRSLNFEHQNIGIDNYQGNSIINYTDYDVPYTRVIEHKHFQINFTSSNTIITKEYPADYTKKSEPYYPINDKTNHHIYSKYKNLSKQNKRFIFGGRLAEYKYYDMDQVIGSALSTEI